MKPRKKAQPDPPEEQPEPRYTPPNPPLHIPLDFETAVKALLHTKPKKKPRDSSSSQNRSS